jgi:hypothetical protein
MTVVKMGFLARSYWQKKLASCKDCVTGLEGKVQRHERNFLEYKTLVIECFSPDAEGEENGKHF